MCLQIDVHCHHLQALLEDYLVIVFSNIPLEVENVQSSIYFTIKHFYQCLVKAFSHMCDDVLNIGAKSGS